jgi:hypothetical protein
VLVTGPLLSPSSQLADPKRDFVFFDCVPALHANCLILLDENLKNSNLTGERKGILLLC